MRRTGLILLGVFGYTFAIRVYGIGDHFGMYGDQVRDWAVAQLPMGELPAAGPPSVAGGRALGPIFYWVMWLIRVTLGPWFDNMPHAGGIGLSFLQSLADALLAYAIWKRLGNLPLAIAVIIMAATAPLDLTLSATIWNPVLAVALSKAAMALLLLHARAESFWKVALVSSVGWLALQAHSCGFFIGIITPAWFVLRDVARRRYRDAAATAFGLQLVIGVLQLPLLWHWMTTHENLAPTTVVASMGGTATAGFSLTRGIDIVNASLQYVAVAPWQLSWLPWLLGACALIVMARRWQDADVWYVAVAPLVVAIVAMGAWTRPFEAYWFLGLVPSIALLIGLGLTHVAPPRFAVPVAAAVCLAAAAAQPARIAHARPLHRLDGYGALVQASKDLVRHGPPIADITAPFIEQAVDVRAPFRLMGGRLDPNAQVIAQIARDGTVTFRTIVR